MGTGRRRAELTHHIALRIDPVDERYRRARVINRRVEASVKQEAVIVLVGADDASGAGQ